MHANCSCKAGNVGYCNHVLALMFKACKFSLYDSKKTDDLNQESDEHPDLACTSQLQRWHAKGRGENIHPQPVMEVTVSKTKLDETKTREGVKSLLYEARMNPSHDLQAEVELKKTLQGITLVLGHFSLKASGIDSSTTLLDGQIFIWPSFKYMKLIHEINILLTVDCEILNKCAR